MRTHLTRLVWCSVCTLLCVPVSARGQESPEATDSIYRSALARADWATAAGVVHPAALLQLRNALRDVVADARIGALGRTLFGVESVADLNARSDAALMAMWLGSTARAWGANSEGKHVATFKPMGHVSGGRDTVLVVTRVTVSTERGVRTSYELTPLIFDENRWRILFDSDSESLLESLRHLTGGAAPPSAG